MPFTIVLAAMFIGCIGSRLQHSLTNLTVSMLASAALIAPICTIYTLVIFFSLLTQQYPAYILIISVAINYISNILHSIFSFATYRKD